MVDGCHRFTAYVNIKKSGSAVASLPNTVNCRIYDIADDLDQVTVGLEVENKKEDLPLSYLEKVFCKTERSNLNARFRLFS